MKTKPNSSTWNISLLPVSYKASLSSTNNIEILITSL